MPLLDRGGVRISYDPGAAGGRTPVLLTHGFSSSAAMWQPNLAALAAGRQVITWDIRGHGGSDSPSDPSRYSEELSVGDMLAVLDAAGVERAVVGGLSLGGYLSLALHLRHPERVAALMLFDTGPGYRSPDGREEWNRRVERTAAGLDERGLVALSNPADRARQRGAAGLALAARGIMVQRGPEIIDSLPGVAVPALVLVGEDDAPFLAPSTYMAVKIPGAVRVVIPGAGHASNADQPEAFDRAVLEFLAGVDAGGHGLPRRR